MFRSLDRFEKLVSRTINKILIYQADIKQKFDSRIALPYQDFLNLLDGGLLDF